MPKPKTLGKITYLRLTAALHEQLSRLTTGIGGYQSTCTQILDSVKMTDGTAIAHVTPVQLERLREWAARDDAGSWQDWARAALMLNGL